MMIAKNYNLLSETGIHEDRHMPVSMWAQRKALPCGAKPAKYRRNDEVRKKLHFATIMVTDSGKNHQWMLHAANKSQERDPILHSLKLSPHKTLTNYKGKTEWRNLVTSPWTKWPKRTCHSGAADSYVPDRVSPGGQSPPGRNAQSEPRHGAHTAQTKGRSPKGQTVIFKNTEVTRQTDGVTRSKLKGTKDSN